MCSQNTVWTGARQFRLGIIGEPARFVDPQKARSIVTWTLVAVLGDGPQTRVTPKSDCRTVLP